MALGSVPSQTLERFLQATLTHVSMKCVKLERSSGDHWYKEQHTGCEVKIWKHYNNFNCNVQYLRILPLNHAFRMNPKLLQLVCHPLFFQNLSNNN